MIVITVTDLEDCPARTYISYDTRHLDRSLVYLLLLEQEEAASVKTQTGQIV